MKHSRLSFIFCFLLCILVSAPSKSQNAIPGDNVMRYYKAAVPVTRSSFEEDFSGDEAAVKQFWSDVEEYLNKVYVPLGFCFTVNRDSRLLLSSYNRIDENYMDAPSYGTELLDELIGPSSYDIGIWILHRPENENNNGLSILEGAYKKDSKASGYAAPNPWIVAHEIAHMFGAGHTEDASLMDAGGNFLSLTSIMQIRSSCVKNNAAYYSDQDKNTLVGSDLGGNYVYGQKVSNTAPAFGSNMPYSVRIPLGACLALDVQADDAENNRISYATVSNDFALVPPTFSSRLDFRPQYVADIFYDDSYYIENNTDIHNKAAGSYSMTVAINDMPDSDILTWQTFIASPFYSNYTTRQIGVDIVGGERFSLSLSPDKQNYAPGDQVRLSWGVNTNYFNSESRLRITLSTDYGKTFNHILAASVPALDGECVVEMPDLKIDNIDVDFSTAVRSVRAGIIRIEEIGGAAYTLSCLSPEGGGGFLLSGSGIPSSISIPGADKSSAGCIYDVSGRKVSAKRASSLPGGIYICNGKKVLVK